MYLLAHGLSSQSLGRHGLLGGSAQEAIALNQLSVALVRAREDGRARGSATPGSHRLHSLH